MCLGTSYRLASHERPMLRIFALALTILTALSAPSRADNPVVVELFTSQGCSYCPPADALLHDLAGRENVIALALHVDYWDYIGWKDAFADPAHTNRQREYALEGNRRSIYTPQMIVNGKTVIVGTKPMELLDTISKYMSMPSPVDLTVKRDGQSIAINASAENTEGSLIVHMVHYVPEQSVKITRGENAGRTLTYANIAQDWNVLAEWNGATPLNLTATAKAPLPVVILVQQGVAGPILAAAEVK